MEWIDAAEAARRLGVKPATLYAYVSRGLLTRRQDGGRSLFNAAEVDAWRGRPRRSAGHEELLVESGVTALAGGRPYYRGRDVLELAAERPYEEVADLLWEAEPGPWTVDDDGLAAAAKARAALPEGTLPMERLQVIVAALAATDPLRLHLDPPGVVEAARRMITGMVAALPSIGAEPRSDASIADRLWSRLTPTSPARPSPRLRHALRASLVLLADHELAASTLAARIAASVRADPYAVVATGLGAVSGALHGGASLGAETMLAEDGPAARVIGERLRRGERIPGFGHYVYKSGDPRATFLLELLGDEVPAAAVAILSETRRRRLPEPNIDFAIAAFTTAAGMARGAAEAIFAIARTAGWIAHAMEEYARGTPLRPRAVYTGPAPQGRTAP